MPPVPVFTLGVFGYAKVSNIQVLLTSGNITRDCGPVYISPLSLPPPTGTTGGASRSKVTYCEGLINVTGNLAFDINETAMTLIDTTKLLKRGYQFPLQIYDSERGYEISNCYVSSMTVNGSAGGILTASLSIVAGPRTGIKEVVDFRQIETATGQWKRDDAPLGYWASGNVNVREWSLSFSQQADPVYLNGLNDTDDRYARYIKVGQIGYVLDVTTFDQIYEYKNIVINTKNFSITGNTTVEGYTFGGASDVGTFNHTFESAALLINGSGGSIISQA